MTGLNNCKIQDKFLQFEYLNQRQWNKLETESACIILVGIFYVKEQHGRPKSGVAFED